VMIDQVENWIGVVVTIGLAIAGDGLMSFAIGAIAGSLTSAAAYIALSPQGMRVGLSLSKAGAMFRVALPLTASGLLAFAANNVDQIIVGSLLHAPDLGYYVLALYLASWPVAVLSQAVRDAASVAFARLRGGPQMAVSVLISSASLLAALTLPVCVLMISSAGPLVDLLYGPVWAPTAHVLVWLAPLATLRVFYALVNDYFTVLAPSRRALAIRLLRLVTLTAALVAAAAITSRPGG